MTWIAVLDQGRRKRLWIKESPVVRLVRKGVEIPRSHSGSSKRARFYARMFASWRAALRCVRGSRAVVLPHGRPALRRRC